MHPVAASRRNFFRTQKIKNPTKQNYKSVSKRDGKILIYIVALLLAITYLLILSARPKNKNDANKAATSVRVFDDPLAVVLTSQTGHSPNDREISRLQQQIRNGRNLQLRLEQLGWAFVAKARES